MPYLNKLLFLIAVLSSALLFGQDDYSNQDWKALNAYIQEDNAKTISLCRELLKKQDDGVAKNRTKFILARTLIETGEFKEAIKLLSATELDATFLKSGILGLIGDCKSEQRKYTQSLEFYTEAFHAEWNETSTPMYLFKAFLCTEKLERTDEGQRLIRTIQFYFPEYAGAHSVRKYLIDDSSHEYIELAKPTATQPSELGIGTINGESVNLDEYYQAMQIATINARQHALQQGKQPVPVDKNLVWNSFVSHELRKTEYAKLNLHSDDEELMAYLLATDGYEALPEFLNSPTFTEEDGNFSPKKLSARIDEMRYSDNEATIQAWADTEEYYIKKLIQEKHQKFVFLSLYSTTLEVNQFIAEEQNYDINYGVELYRDIPDSTIDITTKELETLYESKKNTQAYQLTHDYHELAYIQTTVRPNTKDTGALNSKMKALKKSFERTKDDSSFVVNTPNNVLRFYTSGPYSTAVPVSHEQAVYGKYITFPDGLSSAFEAANVGDVVGPYDFNDQLVIAKVIGRTYEDIEARHVLLDKSYTEEKAAELLKSVTDENFGEMVNRYSQDTGSVPTEGSLGTFFFGDMVPQFATYCADAPIGKIGLVQTQYGYHIVQATKRSGPKLPRLAVVAIPFEISEESTHAAKNKLEEIRELYTSSRSNSKTDDPMLLFNSISESRGEYVRIFKVRNNSPRLFIDSDQLADSLLRFGFDSNTNEGDISEAYVDSNLMVLAVLSERMKAGPEDYESVKDDLKYLLIQNKKAELLLERTKNHTSSRRDELTQRSTISLKDPRLSGGGFEPFVVGKAIRAFNNGQNKIYAKGFAGAYFIEVLSKEKSTNTLSIEEQRDELDQRAFYAFYANFQNHLAQSCIIIDNRDLYRLGVRK